jgi:biotin operon repressor
MIDRIRQDIQSRLDQLLSEADRLRQALSALGGDGGSRSASSGSSSAAATKAPARASRSSASRARGGATRSTATRTRSAASRSSSSSSSGSAGSRAAAGGTKDSVLKALGAADGKALTASEVASATGLGRASVSTTLSKLARAGEVEKAERGYRLSKGGTPAASSNGDAAASAETAAAKA